VIKPLWSPLVDVVKTKRWWILTMQLLITLCFAGLAISVPARTGAAMGPFIPLLIIFYVTAMFSATNDIATDGFYMLALDEHQQSLYVGIRSTFYRISSVFGQGIIVVIAGYLETRLGDIPRAWEVTLWLCAGLFLLLTLWHVAVIPREEMPDQVGHDAAPQERSFIGAFKTFFQKPGVLLALAFMLLYRLPEAFSVKMLTPMLLDPLDKGGLGLSTAQSGLVYGTVGVIALTVGGILGGIFAAHHGLRKSLWPMALALALPCSVYLYMATFQPQSLPLIYVLVAIDQFGYGFGFTAYMLYMMYFSEGEYQTSHYAICTAFMALSMMIPGFFAGMLQESLGYTGFFVLVMVCCLATIGVTAIMPRHIRPNYGKKKV